MPPPSSPTMCKSCLRHTALFICQFICLLVVSMIGGLIMHLCEYDNEQSKNSQNADNRVTLNATIVDLINVMLALVPVEKHAPMKDHLANITAVASLLQAVPDDTNNWDIPGSVWFFTTVQTTIGYGLYAPETTAGQAMICTVGLAGIIVFGFFVGKALDRLDEGFAAVAQIFPVLQNAPGKKLGVYVAGVILYMLIFAAISAEMLATERTDYGTSFYFTIVSFTTIGFGDYAISTRDDGHPVVKLVITVMLMIGLTCVGAVLGAATDILRKKDKAAFPQFSVSANPKEPSAEPSKESSAECSAEQSTEPGGPGAVELSEAAHVL